jgi:hypothetical protein
MIHTKPTFKQPATALSWRPPAYIWVDRPDSCIVFNRKDLCNYGVTFEKRRGLNRRQLLGEIEYAPARHGWLINYVGRENVQSTEFEVHPTAEAAAQWLLEIHLEAKRQQVKLALAEEPIAVCQPSLV